VIFDHPYNTDYLLTRTEKSQGLGRADCPVRSPRRAIVRQGFSCARLRRAMLSVDAPTMGHTDPVSWGAYGAKSTVAGRWAVYPQGERDRAAGRLYERRWFLSRSQLPSTAVAGVSRPVVRTCG